MPMIEAKVTGTLPAEKRDVLKTEFGKAISLMNKPESYLMINLADNQDLYFGGKKLDKGAYVEVKVLGSVDSVASSKMTARFARSLKRNSAFQAKLSTSATSARPTGVGMARTFRIQK